MTLLPARTHAAAANDLLEIMYPVMPGFIDKDVKDQALVAVAHALTALALVRTEEPVEPATDHNVGELARRHVQPYDDVATRITDKHVLHLVQSGSNVAYVLCPNCGFIEHKPPNGDSDFGWYTRISRHHAAFVALVEGVKP